MSAVSTPSSEASAATGERRTIWSPPADAWERSSLADFAAHVASAGGPTCGGYDELVEWSLADLDAFWASFADWAEIRWNDEPGAALADPAMPGATWFAGGTLNYASACSA